MVSSDESEASMDCRMLTTLSGREVAVSTKIAQFDRFEDFEEHIVDHLAAVTDLEVFGREADFVLPGRGVTLKITFGKFCKRTSASPSCFEISLKFSKLWKRLFRSLVLLVFWFCFWCWVLFFVCVVASWPQLQSFPFSNDDLCTLHTWRPYSCKKKSAQLRESGSISVRSAEDELAGSPTEKTERSNADTKVVSLTSASEEELEEEEGEEEAEEEKEVDEEAEEEEEEEAEEEEEVAAEEREEKREGTTQEENNPSAHSIPTDDSSAEDRQEQKSPQAQLERSGDKMPAPSINQAP